MITENTKAILLLTSFFNSNEVKEYKTLTVNEYGYFACWLHQNSYKPVDLLNEESFDSIWASWDEPMSHIKAKQIIDFARLDNTIAKLTYDRIKDLLNRGASLSLALDKWQSAGVWIMDRQHEHYPKAIKKQLKHQSPALFFGVGNPELLTKQAVGFVGSRDCDGNDEQATSQYVAQTNQLDYQVVSGAAKGVDSHAMLASLNNGNTAIGILADSLFRASASGQWRQHLKANNLVLISPFFPEGRFTPANAMTRNKFIYLLSNATVVVTSGEKGGTWEGAKENLKKGWVPLLVSAHQQPLQAGNQALINGDGLGKTKANAQSVSPDVSPEQFSDLILKANQSTQINDEKVNETRSILDEPTSSLDNTDNIPESSVNTGFGTGANVNSQEDLFAMADNFDQESAQDHEQTKEQTFANDEFNNRQESVQAVPHDDVQPVASEEDSPQATLNTTADENVEPTSNDLVDIFNEVNTNELHQHENQSKDLNVQGETVSTEEQTSQKSATPLLDSFYQQLCELIENHPKQLIDKSELDSHFPEFEIMGKQALDKWLKHLVEEGKLARPSAKKKQFTLPKQDSGTK